MKNFQTQNLKFKIAVAFGKGGVGKSMLASSLALLFSQSGKRVVAVDCDVDAPNLHLWLGEADVVAHFSARQEAGNSSKPGFGTALKARLFSLPAAEGWDSVEKISTTKRPVIDAEKCSSCGKCVNICQFGALSFQPDRLRDLNPSGLSVNKYFCEGCGACAEVCPEGAIRMEMVKNAEIRVKENVYGFPLISAQLYPGETGSGKTVDELKRRAESYDYEVMILDSPAGTGCPVIAALQDADFAILVTEPTPSGFSDLKRALVVVDHFQIPFGVVINKWDINSALSQKIAREFKDRLLGKISYDKRVFQAIADLIPIMDTDLSVKGEIEEIFNGIKVIVDK